MDKDQSLVTSAATIFDWFDLRKVPLRPTLPAVGKSLFARWRGNFITGVAVLLPAIASIVVLVWFFRSIANVTDALLFFIPSKVTHRNGGDGPMYWYWSLAAFVLAVLLITLMGRLTKYYVGVKFMELLDQGLLRIPLLNKIYGTIKQVNEAFTSNKSSFKQVVLVEFPRRGQRSVGFVTGEQATVFQQDNEKTVSVFIPTTPNPTSGFMVLVPESDVTKLDMSVADGIKFIVSLGAIPPEAALAARRAEIGATPLVETQTPRALADKQDASRTGDKQDACPTGDRRDACPTTHG